MAPNTSDDKTRPNIIDLMLGKKGETVIDSETMIMETQKRVWGALKKGYEYTGIIDESDKFLREHVFKKINMVARITSYNVCYTKLLRGRERGT